MTPEQMYSAYRDGQMTKEQLVKGLVAFYQNVLAQSRQTFTPEDATRFAQDFVTEQDAAWLQSRVQDKAFAQQQAQQSATGQEADPYITRTPAGVSTLSVPSNKWRSLSAAQKDAWVMRAFPGRVAGDFSGLFSSADETAVRLSNQELPLMGGAAGRGGVVFGQGPGDIGGQGSGGIGGQVPRAGVPIASSISDERRRQMEEEILSATPGGRRQVFEEYIAPRLRGPIENIPGALRGVYEQQFDPYQNLFSMGQGLGRLGPNATFREFLPQGPFGRPDFSAYRSQLGEVGALLSGAEPSDRQRADFYERLKQNPREQFNLLETGFEQDIPLALRPGAGQIGWERFNRAIDVEGIQAAFAGAKANSFADYARQGVGFTGPDPAAYRGAVGQAAGVLGPTEPTDPLQGKLRSDLMKDFDRQFELAYQAFLPDVPYSLRPGMKGFLRQRANQWRANRDVGAQWLPYYQQKGFNFLGYPGS